MNFVSIYHIFQINYENSFIMKIYRKCTTVSQPLSFVITHCFSQQIDIFNDHRNFQVVCVKIWPLSTSKRSRFSTGVQIWLRRSRFDWNEFDDHRDQDLPCLSFVFSLVKSRSPFPFVHCFPRWIKISLFYCWIVFLEVGLWCFVVILVERYQWSNKVQEKW
jgi:hypothetical protein